MFTGVCEIDGVYVGGKTRQINTIADRVDRRKINHPNKRVVISLRQRADNSDEVIGAVKTRTFVLKSENTFDINRIVNTYVTKGSELHADEANAYDDLHTLYDMKRVNHQIEYRGKNGDIANDILTRCLSHGVSNEFSGYWQGNKRVAERLGA